MNDFSNLSDESPRLNNTIFVLIDSFPAELVIILNIISAISFVLGITGNSLVILAVLLSKKLRTTTNAFVVNLSIADLLTSLVIPFRTVLYTLDIQWFELRCYIIAFGVIIHTTVGCSLLTLTSISINRLVLITRPATTYRLIYTPKKIAVWLALAWLVPVLISVLLSLNEPEGSLATSLAVVSVAMLSIPLTIIIVCYVIIWRHLKRHARLMVSSPVVANTISMVTPSDHTSNIPTNCDHTQPPPSANSTTGRTQLSRRQTEITKNMFYVVCAFVLCVITPHVVFLNLILVFSITVSEYYYIILFFNSCINPLIYACKHRDFKTVFGCILRRQWHNIPEPSDFLKAMRRSKCCGRSDPSA